MRREQKKKTLHFIDTLIEAHSIIKRIIQEGRWEQAAGLLEQCQEGAISLGELIEQNAPAEKTVISGLENYCEKIYEIYNGLMYDETDTIDREWKELQEVAENVKKGIKRIQTRLEVAFLPYKASMWDSLESVWRAAKEDSGCDAYVIPIPYFDKKPNGTLGEEHYEGNLYSADVPITSYKEYDFEKRRPDAIFIHNPYDECNYVTTIHPNFYASNLKKFTNMLVYIPYFILREIEPQNTDGLNEIRPFCMLPGVFYADRVIVQSEKMRRCYLGTLKSSLKIMDGTEAANELEKKIVGLGSPKLDAIYTSNGSWDKLPLEWKKRIGATF